MNQIFPDFDWSDKQWSSWYGYRAEAYNKNGQLPNGPVIQEYDNAVVAWPTKLTLVPLLGDKVLSLLSDRGIQPSHLPSDLFKQNTTTELPHGILPWNNAEWFCQPDKS